MVTIRVRSMVWFATGAAMALVVSLLVFQAWSVDAAPGDSDATFVPIDACRLLDTRVAPDRIGPFASWGTADTRTVQATGSNGNCTLPADATALALNVTALNATTDGFLTFWSSGPRPLASSLNPSPGQPPTPNAVTVSLSGAGSFDVYNAVGSVDVLIDVTGYYTKVSLLELTERLTALEAGVAALDAREPFTSSSPAINVVVVLSTATLIREVTVTAPVTGKVAVHGTGTVLETTAGQQVECGIDTSASQPPPGDVVIWEAGNENNRAHMSVGRVFDIAGGSTVTYSLMCRNLDASSSNVRNAVVFATFTPDP